MNTTVYSLSLNLAILVAGLAVTIVLDQPLALVISLMVMQHFVTPPQQNQDQDEDSPRIAGFTEDLDEA